MTMERVAAGRQQVGSMATNLLALFRIDDPTPEQFAGAVAIADAFHALTSGGGKRRGR